MAVSGALRAGRGGFRAVRATERRQVGCGRPSTGSGRWWGVGHYLTCSSQVTEDPGATWIHLVHPGLADACATVVAPAVVLELGSAPSLPCRPGSLSINSQLWRKWGFVKAGTPIDQGEYKVVPLKRQLA